MFFDEFLELFQKNLYSNNTDHWDGGMAVTKFRRFHEHGNYTIHLKNRNTSSKIHMMNETANIIGIANDKPDYSPIWKTFLILVAAKILFQL
jgi:hypothetical protein